MKLAALAKLVGAELVAGKNANGETEITGVAPISAAKAGEVTFLTDLAFAPHLVKSAAAAVIIAKAEADCPAAQLVHKNPYFAFAKAAQVFHATPRGNGKISERADIAKSAKLGKGVTIHSFVTVCDDAVIGDGAELFPGVYVGRGAVIGKDTVLRANAVLEYGCKLGDRVLVHAGAVIGADGFGFAPGETEIAKIPQIGAVTVGSDVEIGPNTTIDRGAMHDTKIGNGTKLDSHVHVAHNCVIGDHCMLCGMSAMAGSSKLGNWVILAGGTCVDNKVEMGDRTTLGGFSAMTKNTNGPGVYIGFPAQPAGEWRRQIVLQRKLPEILQRLKDLESKNK